MNRKLKALCLAFVALLATSAVVASSAQAVTVRAGSYPATLTGTEATTNIFKVGAVREVRCTTTSGDATMTGDSATITAVGSFANCHANGHFAVTVNTNGCDIAVTVKTLSETTGTGDGALVCPVGKEVEASIYNETYSASAPHTAALLCKYSGAAQANVGGTKEFHNIAGTPDDILVTLNLNSLKLKVTHGTALSCGGSGSTVAPPTINGSFIGSGTIKADSASSEPINLTVVP